MTPYTWGNDSYSAKLTYNMSKSVLNSEYFLSETGCPTKAEDYGLLYYLQLNDCGKRWIHAFLKALSEIASL